MRVLIDEDNVNGNSDKQTVGEIPGPAEVGDLVRVTLHDEDGVEIKKVGWLIEILDD